MYAHADINICSNFKNIYFQLLKNESDSLKFASTILRTENIHEKKLAPSRIKIIDKYNNFFNITN